MKTVIEMAREAGLHLYVNDLTEEPYALVVERFAELVRADERARMAEQPAQEPVAWMEMVVANLVREGVNKHKARELAQHFYTSSPAQRKPLTDDQAMALTRGALNRLDVVRKTEAAHGIKENT